MGLFSTKRANTVPSMVASSRASVSKACRVTKGEREDHLNRAGVVDLQIRQQARVNILRRSIRAALEEAPRQDAQPPLHLLAPGAMLGRNMQDRLRRWIT